MEDGTGMTGAPGPEARLQHALDVAFRHLARRERTEMEIKRALEAKRVDPAVIEAALAELRELGYINDARYAARFTEDKRELDHWGPERIRRRLTALGVGREEIDAALAGRSSEEELEAALGILRRRFPEELEDERARGRAYGMLVRKGYAPEFAGDVIRIYDRRAA